MSDDALPVDPDIEPGTVAGEHPAVELRVAAVVFCGGVLGGLSRYQIGRRYPTASGRFPWDTFWVNVSGAFALAVLVVLVAAADRPRWFVRPAAGTGFLGAYTTFSALATATDLLLAHGHVAIGVAYAIGSVLTGSAAAVLGFVLARLITTWQRRRA